MRACIDWVLLSLIGAKTEDGFQMTAACGLPRKQTNEPEIFGLTLGLSDRDLLFPSDPEELLALNDALDGLAREEAEAAELVKLRISGDFSVARPGNCSGCRGQPLTGTGLTRGLG